MEYTAIRLTDLSHTEMSQEECETILKLTRLPKDQFNSKLTM